MSRYYKSHPVLAAQRYNQLGFTLLELMISVVLGLLIVLATLALFFGSSKNVRVQEAAGDVQDAATFSLTYMQREIAMANLGTFTSIRQDSPWTGIVLTSTVDHGSESILEDPMVPRQIGNLRGVEDVAGQPVSGTLLTKSPDSSNPSSTVTSNVDIESDQLTIQYEAPFDLTDCEGNNRTRGQMVVERFFTRVDGTAPAGGPDEHKLVLACDAGWYELVNTTDPTADVVPSNVAPNSFVINDFGDAGAVLMNRVDYFGIQLGVMLDEGLRYIPVSTYIDKAGDDYILQAPVIAVKLGVITRGVNPVGDQTPINYTVLGRNLQIADDSVKYIRRVYEPTIYLKNGVVL